MKNKVDRVRKKFYIDPGTILLCFGSIMRAHKLGGSYPLHNYFGLPYPILDIVDSTSRIIMIIPHPIPTTRNWIYVSYTLSLEGSNP